MPTKSAEKVKELVAEVLAAEAKFGPEGAKLYTDYDKWAAEAKRRGHQLVGLGSHQTAAQHPKTGTNTGVWGHNIKKGWLSGETK
jgi:hypothetical protein